MKLRSNTQFSQAFKSDNFFSALHGTAGRKKRLRNRSNYDSEAIKRYTLSGNTTSICYRDFYYLCLQALT